MSIWNRYPNIETSEFRTLVSVTAQILLQHNEGVELSQELLQQSSKMNAREIESILSQLYPSSKMQGKIQAKLEDESWAHQACCFVLDQVRDYPELAKKISEEYDARKLKMTGVETVLLAGALVVLAMKIKEIHIGSASIKFYKANDAVKDFVCGLIKVPGVRDDERQ